MGTQEHMECYSPIRRVIILSFFSFILCFACFILKFVCIYDLLSSLKFCLPLYVCIQPSLSLKVSLQAVNTTLMIATFQENSVRVAVKKPDSGEKLLFVQILVLPIGSYVIPSSYLTSLKCGFFICGNACKVLNMLLGIYHTKLILAIIFGIHYQSTHR